jgi:hypothetical protein
LLKPVYIKGSGSAIFYRKGVHDLAFGKACYKDGFMFDKPKKNTSCEGKIIKKKKINFLPLLTSPYGSIKEIFRLNILYYMHFHGK